ncbi:adenylate cyclase type 5 [Platysternon megacephalum]|uniref:Adenylate cyclase type 5 n=1 Tax=Platysternon megacephalum TaxID=55544 RepID=A0A4D9EHZ2_9SAUR|nr:adenylate cyclase type 5 [Platysternon megacephalum]
MKKPHQTPSYRLSQSACFPGTPRLTLAGWVMETLQVPSSAPASFAGGSQTVLYNAALRLVWLCTPLARPGLQVTVLLATHGRQPCKETKHVQVWFVVFPLQGPGAFSLEEQERTLLASSSLQTSEARHEGVLPNTFTCSPLTFAH